MPIGQLAGLLVEKLFEGVASEGVNRGAQWVYSNVGLKIGEKTLDFIGVLIAAYIGERSVEFLQEEFPELDEIPSMLGDKIDDSQLAKVGRETLNRLSSDVRNKIQQAGYTDIQIGAAVMKYLAEKQSLLLDWFND